MFSDFAIWYLFLAGTAGGALLCGVVSDVRENARWDAGNASLRLRCGAFGCVGLLALAALMLFLDLGNPYDIWLLFECPLRSVMSVGAWLIAVGLVLSTSVSAMIVLRIDKPWLFRGLELLAAATGVGIMGYTGVLLSSLPSIEFWNTPLLVALFVASAISCGFSFVEAAVFFVSADTRGLRNLGSSSSTLRVVELAMLVAFLASRWFAGGASRQSCSSLLSGQLAGLFWFGVATCGFVIPLLTDAFTRLVDVPALRLVGAASTLGGGACLRYCAVLAASYSAISIVVT